MFRKLGLWALLCACIGLSCVQAASTHKTVANTSSQASHTSKTVASTSSQAPRPNKTAASIASLGSGVRVLYQNDLDWNKADSSARQDGYLLLTTPLTADDAATKCQALGETLVSPSAYSNPGLMDQMNYLFFERTYFLGQIFWAANGTAFAASSSNRGTKIKTVKPHSRNKYPALCTQSAPWKRVKFTDTSKRWQVTARSNGVEYTGYRDALSFRFLAVPYANPTERFTYSSMYDASTAGNSSISALDTTRSKQCPQAGQSLSSEHCQVTNIFTPYLPSASDVSAGKSLKPVFVWIHGGAYYKGTGLDHTFDGGNMASRSDVVVLTVNYRLGSLGYLAYNDEIRGNYGLSDLVTALQWVQKYIKDFGGDPDKVTIGGQSAGAQQVENLLASPAAAGLFHRAMVFSGKGHDASFIYPTIAQARQDWGGQVVQAVGCDTAPDVLACLRSKSVEELVRHPSANITQDGTYITSPRLDMRRPDQATGFVNRVPVIWGTMRDEMAALGIVPPASETNLTKALSIAGISPNYTNIVLQNNGTFNASQYGVQNLTVTVNTDVRYRCGIQGMAYASVINNVFPRVYAYFFDQRSYQIPNYDPQGVCKAKPGNLDPSSNYLCHSGELFSIFHTAGITFGLPYRDSNDLAWMAMTLDQFSAFIRTGSPTPSVSYLEARGEAYASTLQRTTSSDNKWTRLTSNNQQGVSFGPIRQRMQSIAQRNDQCVALGKGIDYIANLTPQPLAKTQPLNQTQALSPAAE